MLLSLIVPCYNEASCIPEFLSRVDATMQKVGLLFEIIFIDDGSQDQTVHVITDIIAQRQDIRLVRLSRNFGKEAALTAGIQYATGDVLVPLDCDLQDPPELIPQMIQKWQEGNKVVLALRRDRSTDSVLKRTSARLFYSLFRRISHIDIPADCGDFRLIDRSVAEAILKFPERNRFMKGIMAATGFQTTYIEYARPPRISGKSSFNGWKLWNFALDGITSFSTFPLRVWSYLGIVIAITALFYAAWTVFRTLFWGVVTPGHATLLTTMLLLGAVILIGLGIQGEYIARIMTETKARPLYIVENTLGFKEGENAHANLS